MISDVAKRKILGLVGLGLRGRLAVVGVQQVREAVKRGKLKVALVASDASQNSLDKVSGLLKARMVPVIDGFSAQELGQVAGRESVAVIGVTDGGLTRGIRSAAAHGNAGKAEGEKIRGRVTADRQGSRR
ncbi:MAG TPA: ribosomal L7Ae/L30e/S12e/Gadd45 family protein [Gemmatimonadaceae bacterium]|nr:ribosomal L7Ae/L30e/S12e/Gadd45 family protein [Gemmatimonadaceae bacterium]